MTTKSMLKTRDTLVSSLMELGRVRDDLFMKHVWASFQHFILVYHMDSNVKRIANTMPMELKDMFKEAA